MNTSLKLVLACGLIALLSHSGLAQNLSDRRWGGCSGDVSGVDVSGAYSAIQDMDAFSFKSDGTRVLDQKIQRRLYHDSQGRSRDEGFLPKRPGDTGDPIEHDPVTIRIYDPVIGVRYTLDVRKKVAQRCVMTPVPTPPARSAAAGSVGASPQAGIRNPSAAEDEFLPKRETKSLGTQMMEGLLVEGNQTTTNYPIHARGIGPPNEQPFAMVEEVWFSRELHLRMLAKLFNPRMNSESVDRFTIVSRSEPDITLFQVPPGYTIQDQAPTVPAR